MKLKLRRSHRAAPGSPTPQGDGSPEALFPPESEMSFLEHLEELRWSLLKGLGGVLVTTIIAAFFSDWIIEQLLLGPKKPDFFMYRLLHVQATEFTLQNRTLPGQFFVQIGTIVAAGVVLGSPVFVYYLWKFIEPGLYPHEKKGLRFASWFATGFFILGLAFGYCIITPFAVQFFATYSISPEIRNDFDITRYFGMVTWWAFGAGILFELPVIIYFLAKLGLATPERLRKSRKYAIIVVLILGAVFTPPDPVSQVLVAMPLMVLYEFSIYIAGFAIRQRERELRKAWGDDKPSDSGSGGEVAPTA